MTVPLGVIGGGHTNVSTPESSSAATSLAALMEGLQNPSATESMASILQAYLQYNPELAAQAWGLAQRYMPQYAAMNRELTGLERASDIGDVARLTPQLRGIREAAERPEATAMRNLLFSQIGGDLALGGTLNPEQERDVVQGTRSAQMARGLGMGQGEANRESVTRALEGMRLLRERQGAASGLLAQEATQQIDPFMAVLGRPANATTLAAQQTQQGSGQANVGQMSQNYWNSVNNANTNTRYQAGLQVAMMNPYLTM